MLTRVRVGLIVWTVGGIILLAAVTFATTASAMTYFLERDLGTQGLYHYCVYSNGKTYSFNAMQLCSLSIEDAAGGFGGGVGFKQGEYVDGMTKVCVYSVLGKQQFLRIGGVELCPPTYQFSN
jgi:hypothetical protein